MLALLWAEIGNKKAGRSGPFLQAPAKQSHESDMSMENTGKDIPVPGLVTVWYRGFSDIGVCMSNLIMILNKWWESRNER
jgi:hypothetical protein